MNNNTSSATPLLVQRLLASACGLVAGAVLGALSGMFWLALPGMMLGALCGALVGAVTPPRVAVGMLLGYITAGMFGCFGLLIWWGRGQSKAWMESPIGSGPSGLHESLLAWPLSIFCGLFGAALGAVVMARPWQKPTQRLLNWVGLLAAILPLAIPGAGASWLLAAEREGEAYRQAHDDEMDRQRRAQTQDLEREKTRLRAAAQQLAPTLGELQYPGASPAALSSDGMSFTCETNDSLPTVVAYYEKLLGRRFRVRPASDGGSSRFYNDFIKLVDAREVYVYIEPPVAPSVTIRITLAPV